MYRELTSSGIAWWHTFNFWHSLRTKQLGFTRLRPFSWSWQRYLRTENKFLIKSSQLMKIKLILFQHMKKASKSSRDRLMNSGQMINGNRLWCSHSQNALKPIVQMIKCKYWSVSRRSFNSVVLKWKMMAGESLSNRFPSLWRVSMTRFPNLALDACLLLSRFTLASYHLKTSQQS